MSYFRRGTEGGERPGKIKCSAPRHPDVAEVNGHSSSGGAASVAKTE